MGFFKDLTDVAKVSRTVAIQNKKIDELETKVVAISGELKEAQSRLQEAIALITTVTHNQQALAADMGQIYNHIQEVAMALQGATPDEDERYFSWRWDLSDDDDDLPN